MMIRTELRKATANIGTRVVAETEDGHRAVELYDWNKSPGANHEAAAQLIAGDAHLRCMAASGEHVLMFQTLPGGN